MALPSSVPKPPSPATRPDVWRGDELAVAEARVIPTGHGTLDAQLPGGGWPVGALTEVLQAAPEAQVWRLLLPALALAVRMHGGRVVLVGAPQVPFAPVLAAGGLPMEALMWVRGDAANARCWACEQALRCADVAAVLAWLPQARAADLRRLQLAAARHGNLLFVFRPEAQAVSASPARLRLRLRPVMADVRPRAGIDGPPGQAGHAGRMDVDVLKRRGPPLASPLALPAHGERLAALLGAAAHRRQQRRREPAHGPAGGVKTAPVVATPMPVPAGPLMPMPGGGPSDAVDRVAVAA